MPEPLSLLGTASTLTLTAARVVKLLYELHSTLQDAPLILSSVIAECAGMRASLAVLQSAWRTLVEGDDQAIQVFDTIDDMLMSCALTLSVLEREVQTYLVIGKSPHDEHAVKGCRMIISEDYLSKLLDQLRGQRAGLAMLMTALNSKSLQVIREYAEDNRTALNVIAKRASLTWRESDRRSKRISSGFVGSWRIVQERYPITTSTQINLDRNVLASIPYQRQISYACMLEERQGMSGEDTPEWPDFAAWQSPVLRELNEEELKQVLAPIEVVTKSTGFVEATPTVPLHSPRTSCTIWQYDDIIPALQMALESCPDLLSTSANEVEDELKSSPTYARKHEHASVTDPTDTNTLKNLTPDSKSPHRAVDNAEKVSTSKTSLGSNADTHSSGPSPLYDTIDGHPPPQAKIKVSIEHNANRQRFLSSLKDDPCTLGHIEKAFANTWYRTSSRYKSSLATRKIVLIGGYVGKTTLMHKLFRCYDECQDEISAEYHARISLDSAQFKLRMYEDISLGGYSTMRSSLWHECHIAVICYSIGQRNSLMEVDEWVMRVRSAEPECSLVLLGCQSDLRYDSKTLHHAVRYDEGLETARRLNAMVYLECSAKTSSGVNDVFEILTKCCVLSDKYGTRDFQHTKQRHQNKKQAAITDSNKLPIGFKKPKRLKYSLLAASWLTDRLAA